MASSDCAPSPDAEDTEMRKRLGVLALLTVLAAILAAIALTDQPSAPGVDASIRSGNVARTFTLYRPGSAGARPALVLVLHGAGANGRTMEALTQFDPLADAKGFVVAYPDGGWQLGCCDAYDNGSGDLTFLTGLIDHLAKTDHIDVSRVYVVGFSAGGAMAYRMGCQLSSRVAAIASVGGFEYLSRPCGPDRAVSVYEIHGTSDYYGGSCGGQTQTDRGCSLGSPGYEPSVAQTNRQWRQIDRCGAPHTTIRFGSVVRTQWPSCAGSAAVQLDTIAHGTHCYPQPDSCANYDATSAIWRFFAPRRLGLPRPR
jgi:polyhydroxybutyrate depolymerase